MRNRNLGKVIKLDENGKYSIGFGLKFDIIGVTRDSVTLRSIDTDKYYYEKGYETTVSRKINFNTKTFRFDNKTFNIENVAGMKEYFEDHLR